MPVRRLALAALLLLVPVPAQAQPVAEPGPVTGLESPADDPRADGSDTAAPEDPADAAAPETPDAGDGATTPPDGPSAPATVPDARSVTGSEPSQVETGATGQLSTPGPAETTGPAVAQAVGPQHVRPLHPVVTDDAQGAGPPPAQEPTLHGAPADEGAQVVPGRVDRISLGALTRVPAQDSAGTSALPPAGWGLVVSSLAAVAAAGLLLHRRRTGRTRP